MRKKVRALIFNVDAFLWLEEKRAKSIHGVVTDPPFGVKEFDADQLAKMENNKGIWRLPHAYDGNNRKPAPRFTVLKEADIIGISEFHKRLSPLIFKTLVPGAHVIIASHVLFPHLITSAFLNAGFEFRGTIVRLVKTLRGGDRPKGAHEEFREVSVIPRSGWEPWLVFRKPCEGLVKDNLVKWYTGGLRRPAIDKPFWDVIQSHVPNRLERDIAPHPSLKPQSFIRQIVRAVLPLGKGVILDPFAGSGSTLAAAEYLGYKSIGLEIYPPYFVIAKKAIPKLVSLGPFRNRKNRKSRRL